MSTINVTLSEDIYNVSVQTVENITRLITNVDVYTVSIKEDGYQLVIYEEESFNVSNTIEVYKVTTGVEEVYNVTVIMSGGGGAGIASIADLVPAGDFDKQTIIWSNSQQSWIKNPDPTAKGEGGVPAYFSIDQTNVAEGYVSVADSSSVWTTSKALLKEITVDTASTDWALVIFAKSSGVPGEVPDRTIMDHGYLYEKIALDLPYEDEDESNKIHLYFNSYSGSDVFDIYVLGTELI